MMESNEFMNISNVLFNSHIEDWIAKKGKVLGYYCNNIPSELIHAAGFIPFRIRGTGNTDFLQSDTVLSRYNCTFVRSTFNLAMNNQYDFLDGLLVLNSCDHIRRMYDIWKRKVESVKSNKIKLFFMSYPHTFSDEGKDWMREELKIFRKEFSEVYNIDLTDEKIQTSLEIYSENTELMKKVNEQRSINEPKINGSDFFKIAIANDSVRKEFANENLKNIINNLKNKEPLQNIRARLMLMGSSSDNPDFIKMIEHNGGIVVADTLCTGTRSFMDENISGIDCETKGNTNSDKVMDELVQRTFGRTFCPRMMNGHKNRLDIIKSEIKNKKIDGLILQRIEFCDLHGCENMLYQHEFEELGIPVLSIDREYFLGDTGRLRTRIEAFLEKIGS